MTAAAMRLCADIMRQLDRFPRMWQRAGLIHTRLLYTGRHSRTAQPQVKYWLDKLAETGQIERRSLYGRTVYRPLQQEALRCADL